jgi:hypothetical protein
MAIVKKHEQFITFIDKDFKTAKTGKSITLDVKFHFPIQFVKEAKDGKTKYISLNSDKLSDFIFESEDKKEGGE